MDILNHHPALVAALIIAMTAAATDLRARVVPNRLVAVGALTGLILNCWSDGAAGLMSSLAGALVGFGIFFPFFLLGGMGGGDIKLMGALGACLGVISVAQTAVVAAFVGAVIAVAVAARTGVLLRTLSGAGRLLVSWFTAGPRKQPELSLDNPEALKIPYALPIAAGAMLVVKKRDGQNLVEFAIVVVLLLALVLGIVEFGRVWMTFQVVTNASREGARVAALPTGFSTAGDVSAKVNAYMTSANLDPSLANITITNVDGATGTDAVVTVQYTADLMFLGPVVKLLDSTSSLPGTVTLTGTATMRNE